MCKIHNFIPPARQTKSSKQAKRRRAAWNFFGHGLHISISQSRHRKLSSCGHRKKTPSKYFKKKLKMPKEFHEFDMTKPPGASWGIRIGGGVDRGKVLVLEKVSRFSPFVSFANLLLLLFGSWRGIAIILDLLWLFLHWDLDRFEDATRQNNPFSL